MFLFFSKTNLFFSKSWLPFFLAWRYFSPPKVEQAQGGGLVKICLASIALTASSLFFTFSLSWGFCKEITNAARGAIADLVLYPKEDSSDSIDTCGTTICKSLSGWAAATSQNGGPVRSVFLRGLEGKTGAEVCPLKAFLRPAGLDLDSVLQSNQVLVGAGLEDLLQEEGGGLVLKILVPHGKKSSRSVRLSEHKLTVAGSIKTGISDFDQSTIVGSNDLLEELFGPEVRSNKIFFAKIPAKKPEPLIKQLFQIWPPLESDQCNFWKQTLAKANPEFKVLAWTDFYSTFFKAIRLEQLAIFLIILILIILSLSNLSSLILVQVIFRSKEIAILRILGMGRNAIKAIFAILGGLMAATGLAIGLGLAWIGAWALEAKWRIPLPAGAYPIDHLPFTLQTKFLFWIAIPIILAAIAISWLTASKAMTGSFAEKLREN